MCESFVRLIHCYARLYSRLTLNTLYGFREKLNLAILIGELQQTLLERIWLLLGQCARGADGHQAGRN